MDTRSVAVIGLGYGDEGKGTIVDYLTHKFKYKHNVRYNGGPQAAHNVVTPEGKHHCFAQFGAGMFNPECEAHLGKNMLVDPITFVNEITALSRKKLGYFLDKITIDPECYVVTHLHVLMNQIRETSIQTKWGSVGMGVGEAAHDRIRFPWNMVQMKDLADEVVLCRKLQSIHDYQVCKAHDINHSEESRTLFLKLKHINFAKLAEELLNFNKMWGHLIKPLETDLPVIYESAQGALLDVDYGFYPYVTKTDTLTVSDDVDTKIGVLRAYSTRHGPGPFVPEYQQDNKKELHNRTNEWQGNFRTGCFDMVAAKYAVDLVPVDSLAITHLDAIKYPLDICFEYSYGGNSSNLDKYFLFEKCPGTGHTYINQFKRVESSPERNEILENCGAVYKVFHNEKEFLDYISKELNTPISVLSRGPTRNDKVFL